MNQRTFRQHTRMSKDHTKHCLKCGLPTREGCKSNDCNDVKHCACAMTSE